MATNTVIVMCCLLSALAGFSSAGKVPERCEQKGKIVCPCGLTTVEVAVDLCRQKGGSECVPCKKVDVDGVCARYEYCSTCFTEDGTCDTCYRGRSGRYCEKVNEKASKGLTITNYVSNPIVPDRFRRIPQCHMPKGFNSADLHCFVTEDEIICEEMCSWGHKMDKGITGTFVCDKNTGTWVPEEPQECKPFVNCDVKFAGKYRASRDCEFNSIDGPVKCNITCGSDVSHHVCTLDGNWFPSLPICVEKNSDYVTVGYYCDNC